MVLKSGFSFLRLKTMQAWVAVVLVEESGALVSEEKF